LAQQALGLYPLRIEDWRFLSHGENATFRVTANGGKRFLLRIHRNGYHTPSGILEELHWLQRLSRDSTMIVPRPILSKRGRLLENVQTRSVGAVRHCSVLEWIDGRFIKKSLNRAHLHSLGKLIGRLHRFGRTRQVVERRYWDAEGLLGSCAKLGSTDDLPGLSASDQKVISDSRRYILRNLKSMPTFILGIF
jgi:Ser/Thr protein kinase RdoA (MazF antagonist)